MSLLLWPLEMIAACEGRSRSIRSVVMESTGLSAAHLSQSGMSIRNAKRLRQVKQHVSEHSRRVLGLKGYDSDEVEKILASCPDTPLAGMVYRLGQASPAQLDLAISFAARVDRLGCSAVESVEADALTTYKLALDAFLEEELSCYPDPEARGEFDKLRVSVLAGGDWADLLGPTEAVAEYTLLSVLAAVDADWGARYFGKLRPAPTLLWLAPRFHPDFDPENSKGIKRDVLSRPVGNLLRLMWILAKRGTSKHRAWPDTAPGPSLLARDVAHEATSDVLIRKWSAGVKPATLDQLAEVWQSLCSNLSDGLTYELPLPWIAVALWMERALIRRRAGSGKPETVLFLSDTAYLRVWAGHRERWSAQLPEPGDHTWPERLLAQSAWPEWMRSSQSGGRDSSPRDCQ